MRALRAPRTSAIGPTRASPHRSQPRELPNIGPALACTAITGLFISPIFGTIGAGLFLICVIGLIATRPLPLLNDLIRFSPLFVLPFLTLASTLWSDSPPRTMRAALQVLLTVVAVVAICRSIRSRQLILTLFVGYLVICAWSLIGLPAALRSGNALLGPYESKNQLAYGAQTLLIAAMAIAADAKRAAAIRLLALAAIPLSLVVLLYSASAGANLSAGICLIIFPALLMFGRINMSWRVGILIAIIILTGVTTAFLPDLEQAWADFRVNVLKKDATYTGRTYLWDFARLLIAERPFLGHGYGAFWRHGNIDAEGLWRYAGIGNRSGFNFHNAFLEITVDLGLVGLIALVGTCFGVVFAAFARQFTKPTITMAFFLTYSVTLYIRNSGETSLITVFNLVTILWLATAVYAFEPDENAVPEIQRFRGGKLKPR